jgi:hypothetical protein
LSIDSLRAGVRATNDSDEEALYTLAAGVAHLVRGELAAARLAFELVRSIGDWASLPYLAAEAELRRLRDHASPARSDHR